MMAMTVLSGWMSIHFRSLNGIIVLEDDGNDGSFWVNVYPLSKFERHHSP